VRRFAVVSMMTVGLALLFAGWAPPAGASSGSTILIPTSVKALSVDGFRGVLVAWQPLPAGRPTVDYYIAYTYNQQHTCQVPGTGPYHCILTGLNGGHYFPIRVRAVTTSGDSHAVHATQTILQPHTGGTSPGGSSSGTGASTGASTGATNSATNSADAPATAATSAPSTTDTDLAELPYTGIDLENLLLVGLGLVAFGLLLVSSSVQRRRVRRCLLWWVFGI
jgi:LPXTG-motif cell wall-anchored protein